MSPSPHPPFAVVIPAYNHGGTVADIAQKTLAWQAPVVVVDDGSTDDTCKRLRSISNIEILRHPCNRGKGAALLSGFRHLGNRVDWVVTLDADGQHDPTDIGALMSAVPASGKAIVIGCRKGMETAPWTSRSGRAFSNFWVWVSGGVYLHDTQTGMRVYPLPEVLTLKVEARRYQFEVEVLAKAAWAGLPIIEVPVSVRYSRSGSRISHFRPIPDFFRNTGTFARLITRRVVSPPLWRITDRYKGQRSSK